MNENNSVSERNTRVSNAALLIDFDNVTMGIRSDLQQHLKKLLATEIFKGKVSVQRAYADWRRYPQYIVPLSEASIDLIFAPAFGANKKNATDIRLAIDALELVFTRPEIGAFILLSGDGDFSSLVLKLKEYGKYVIGVGIRESSSNLLVQNCDEYYSYSELTGFAREGAEDLPKRDPWELVVQAVLRMKENGDVMRSDRLKQVMQEIDSHFSEKNAGFNRFGKFVAEAGKRLLLRLTKMENGQYEIAIGPDANIPPELEVDAQAHSSLGVVTQAEPVVTAKLTLSGAFRLLRRSLEELGEGPHAAEHVRQRMLSINDGGSDPVLEGSRFNRLLRQAHDAELIEVAKSDTDGYLVRLSQTSAGEKSDSQSTEREDAAQQAVKGVESSRGERGDKKGKRPTARAAKQRGIGFRKGATSKSPSANTAEQNGADQETRVVSGPQSKKSAPGAKRAARSTARPEEKTAGKRKGAQGNEAKRPRETPTRASRPKRTREAPTGGSGPKHSTMRNAKGSKSAQSGRRKPPEPSAAEPAEPPKKDSSRRPAGILRRMGAAVQKTLRRDPADEYEL